MSWSAGSSTDYDIEKVGGRPYATHRVSSPDRIPGNRLSRSGATSPATFTFDRSSPAVSATGSINHERRPRRSSDSGAIRAQFRKLNNGTPDFLPSPTSTRLPPFAPKACEDILHPSPPVELPSLPLKHEHHHSSKSVDVIEAVKTPMLQRNAWRSTKTLMSTIQDQSQTPSSTFTRRVFEAAKPDLVRESRGRKSSRKGENSTLDLLTLARMNQHVLQGRLVEQVKAISEKGAWMEIGVKQTLHDYCRQSTRHDISVPSADISAGQAVRDMEYMETSAIKSSGNDPFLLSTAHWLECKLLEDAGLAFGDAKRQLTQTSPDELAYAKRESESRRELRRLLMSFLGGLAVLAPFLVMVLLSGQIVRLVATCGFTMAFAAIVTLCSELSPDRIALVVGAYAAVLAIFVANNPSSFRYS